MSRNVLYLVIAVLVIVVAGLAYQYYQQQHQPGVQINIGPGGASILTK